MINRHPMNLVARCALIIFGIVTAVLITRYHVTFAHFVDEGRVPLISLASAWVGGFAKGSTLNTRSRARQLELIFGLATTVAALALSIVVISFDLKASRVVGYEFVVAKELTLIVGLFLLPGGLVCVGAYVHALKVRLWGQFVLAAGCLTVIGSFLFLFAILPFMRLTTWSVLNLSFVISAIMALISSFITRRQSR